MYGEEQVATVLSQVYVVNATRSHSDRRNSTSSHIVICSTELVVYIIPGQLQGREFSRPSSRPSLFRVVFKLISLIRPEYMTLSLVRRKATKVSMAGHIPPALGQ
jgi:hypothetical protein